MIAIVLVAFAAHVVAWLVLPESSKAAKSAAEAVRLGVSVQPAGI